MRLGISRNIVLVAGFVALAYTGLAVSATGCLLSHSAHASATEHHDSHEAVPHNALCALACQSTSDIGLIVESPDQSTEPVILLPAAAPYRTILSFSSYPLHSRAPPSLPFAVIG